MRIHRLLWIMLALDISGAAAARSSTPKAGAGWVYDGGRTCTFDAIRSTSLRCTQYHKVIEHKTSDGKNWSEYRWMWKGRNGREVYYRARIGLAGVSNFTIGEVFDRNSNLPGHRSRNAVSYSPNREELVIGVPGDGYEFSVTGGAF